MSIDPVLSSLKDALVKTDQEISENYSKWYQYADEQKKIQQRISAIMKKKHKSANDNLTLDHLRGEENKLKKDKIDLVKYNNDKLFPLLGDLKNKVKEQEIKYKSELSSGVRTPNVDAISELREMLTKAIQKEEQQQQEKQSETAVASSSTSQGVSGVATPSESSTKLVIKDTKPMQEAIVEEDKLAEFKQRSINDLQLRTQKAIDDHIITFEEVQKNITPLMDDMAQAKSIEEVMNLEKIGSDFIQKNLIATTAYTQTESKPYADFLAKQYEAYTSKPYQIYDPVKKTYKYIEPIEPKKLEFIKSTVERTYDKELFNPNRFLRKPHVLNFRF
jgi:hypothetical protein